MNQNPAGRVIKALLVPSCGPIYGDDGKILQDISTKRTLWRCNAAIKLMEKEDFDFLILSGGPIKARISHAEQMRTYLESSGVDFSTLRQIITECVALDTFDNVFASMWELLKYTRGPVTLSIVSERAHLLRFEAICEHRANTIALQPANSFQLIVSNEEYRDRPIPAILEWLMLLLTKISPQGRNLICDLIKRQRYRSRI